MQIFINSNAYEVDAGLSVEAVKSMIENKEFIPADQIRLMADGRVLEFGTLSANGVADEDELAVALEVEAGMRRKWRKKRMRRLRRKVRCVKPGLSFSALGWCFLTLFSRFDLSTTSSVVKCVNVPNKLIICARERGVFSRW